MDTVDGAGEPLKQMTATTEIQEMNRVMEGIDKNSTSDTQIVLSYAELDKKRYILKVMTDRDPNTCVHKKIVVGLNGKAVPMAVQEKQDALSPIYYFD